MRKSSKDKLDKYTLKIQPITDLNDNDEKKFIQAG